VLRIFSGDFVAGEVRRYNQKLWIDMTKEAAYP